MEKKLNIYEYHVIVLKNGVKVKALSLNHMNLGFIHCISKDKVHYTARISNWNSDYIVSELRTPYTDSELEKLFGVTKFDILRDTGINSISCVSILFNNALVITEYK